MNQNKLFTGTRWRLALWYTGVMSVILGLCGVGLYGAIAHAHWVALNRELSSIAGTIHDSLEPVLKQPGKLEPNVSNLLPDLCLAQEKCLQKFTSHQERMQGESQRHTLGVIHEGDYYLRLFNLSKNLVAVAGYPLEVNQRYQEINISLHTRNHQDWGYLQVRRSLKDYDQYLIETKFVLLLGLPLSLALIGGASWWLAGRAMQPVYTSYAQIQQFTADAAHELRTPLAAIQATVESALRIDKLAEEEARDILSRVDRQNQRLSQLVKDLLLLSRMDQQGLQLKRQKCCLNDLINDIAEEFAALAMDAGVQLTTKILVFQPLYIRGDEEQLYRLLANLVVNAIQYTPSGGEITLSLDDCNYHAVILVNDTGIGIAPKHQKHIFDRFYRINSDRSRHTGGSGLGLAIASAIVAAHQGTIQVTSELGKGTTFTIRLPLAFTS